MENEKEDKIALAVIAITPLIIYIAVFIWILTATFHDSEMIAFNICLIIGCVLALLSAIIILIFKFDLTKYGEQFVVSIVFFVIAVLVSWFVMFETGSITIPLAIPIILLTVFCYIVSTNCEEERDTFMFLLVHPTIYYMFLLVGFILSFNFHWEKISGS